ncbi:ABC transporter permease subunit [Bacillus aerolatus]|uniref:ABC transporter permease subunit n=1 Tax=Bacillus aerolatus TaxID=2653354 RepID=A0A6I1FB10_9BACI|nr:ABC transporter permease [Bacillus aerolatus]KAB7704236.1 ABC transporter permease subunit [Bacillus aerolatus]
MEKLVKTEEVVKRPPLIPLQNKRNGKPKSRKWLQPQENIPHRLYIGISISSIVLLFAVWSLLTYSGMVDPLFLPTPTEIIHSGVILFTEFGFINDISITIYRVLAGFTIAVIIGLPLGILMGTFKVVEAFFEPVISSIRYMPASAFIPLFILWIGVGELEKITIIFVGTFFSLVLMTAVEVANVRRELLEAAYTLGRSNFGVLRSVILPASIPGIMEIIRLILGWAWSYIIVAELVASSSGIGSLILESQRMLKTGNIIFGILTIGVLGLLSDLILKVSIRKMFPWHYGR